jgi:hypothetical protein
MSAAAYSLRFVTEVCGFLAVGAAANYCYSPSKKDYDNFAKASEDILEQSRSLAVELTEVIKKLDGIHTPKILGAIMHDSELSSKRLRNIDAKDLDEFSRSIMLGDENTDLPGEDDQLMPDSPSHKVIEKYRLISAPDLEKIATAAADKSKLRQRKRRAELTKADMVGDAMIDTIDAISDTSFLVTSLTEKFQKQQMRLQRCLDKKAAEIVSPADDFYNATSLLTTKVVGYALFCAAMKKYWPTAPSLLPRFTSSNPRSKALATSIICLVHLSISSVVVQLSSPVDSSRLIVAEDKSIYSTYFNPTVNTFQITVYEDDIEDEGFAESILDFFGFDIDELRKPHKPAEIPLVWPLATLRDPFTTERLSMNLLIKPFFEEFLYRAVLMRRLMVCGGVLPALLVTPLVYAFEITASVNDLRAMMHHLTMDTAYELNVLTGATLSLLYLIHGSMKASLLFNSAINGYYMLMELKSRGDIIKEASECYRKEFTVPLSLISMALYYQPLLMAKCGLYPTVHGITSFPGRPTAEVKQFTEALIEVHGRPVSNKDIKNGKDASLLDFMKSKNIVVSPEEAYDIIQSLQHATSERQGFSPGKHAFGFMAASYAPPSVRVEYPKHYSYVRALPGSKLDLVRGDFIRNYLHTMFPKGMTSSELLELVTAFLLFEAGKDKKPRDLKRLAKDMVKWETQATSTNEGKGKDMRDDDEFLDLIDNMYKTRLNKLLIEAVLFGVWRSSSFLDDLAGRKTVPQDIKRFKEELSEWMTYANRRATDNSLQAYGLTPLRFQKLLKLFDEKYARQRKEEGAGGGEGDERSPAAALTQQWEDYFAGEIYEKQIYDIVNPFGGGKQR